MEVVNDNFKKTLCSRSCFENTIVTLIIIKHKLKIQNINIVFNYSKILLTEAMDTVLNRGLKFAIQPLKLDITQVLTDFTRFEQNMVWKEFWFGKESEDTYAPPIFKRKKSTIFLETIEPQRAFQNFLAAVKSDIVDPKKQKTGLK